MKFDPEGNVTSFGEVHDTLMTKKCNRHIVGNAQQNVLSHISFSSEKKKTELYQELGLQARDLRFQHLTSITSRNNAVIIRMEVIYSSTFGYCSWIMIKAIIPVD